MAYLINCLCYVQQTYFIKVTEYNHNVRNHYHGLL